MRSKSDRDRWVTTGTEMPLPTARASMCKACMPSSRDSNLNVVQQRGNPCPVVHVTGCPSHQSDWVGSLSLHSACGVRFAVLHFSLTLMFVYCRCRSTVAKLNSSKYVTLHSWKLFCFMSLLQLLAYILRTVTVCSVWGCQGSLRAGTFWQWLREIASRSASYLQSIAFSVNTFIDMTVLNGICKMLIQREEFYMYLIVFKLHF